MVNIYDLTKDDIYSVVSKILSPYENQIKGKDVLIKPNLLGAYDPEHGATTHPVAVNSVYKILKSLGSIPSGADSPGGLVNDFEFAASVSGLKQACEDNFISLTRNVQEASLPLNKKIPKILISQLYMSSFFIVNMPKMKTHTLTTITGAIKNLYGIIPGSLKLRLHSEAPSIIDFSQLLVDIYQIRPPNINIMEAITAMEGDGPAHGKTRMTNLILSSDNAVELDAVASYMMGINPFDVHHLRIAHARDLGEINVKKIKINGRLFKISNYKHPSTYKTIFERSLNRYSKLIALKPEVNAKACDKCDKCIQNCPLELISMKDFPIIERSRCISCFVCAENCPQGAIYIPSLLNELILRIKRRIIK